MGGFKNPSGASTSKTSFLNWHISKTSIHKGQACSLTELLVSHLSVVMKQNKPDYRSWRDEQDACSISKQVHLTCPSSTHSSIPHLCFYSVPILLFPMAGHMSSGPSPVGGQRRRSLLLELRWSALAQFPPLASAVYFGAVSSSSPTAVDEDYMARAVTRLLARGSRRQLTVCFHSPGP